MADNSDEKQVQNVLDNLVGEVVRRTTEPIGREPTVNNWSVRWPTWTDAGRGHQLTWGSDENYMLHYKQLLGQYGYKITKLIAERKEQHEHQLILVTKPVDYACKVVSMGFYKRKYDNNMDQSVVAFRKESDILLRMNHPNIIQTIDHIELGDRQTGFPYNYAALVLELMDGTVDQLRRSCDKGRLPEWLCRLWVRDVVQALDYMHNTSPGKLFTVVHMAIAPRNILYRVVHNGALITYLFKLADFEECYIYEGDVQQLMPASQVAHPYRTGNSPPELKISARSSLPAMLTPPMDMYSLGACLYWTYTRRLYTQNDFINSYKTYTIPIINFIYSLTRPQQFRRLTARQALRHQWLQQ